MNNIIKSVVWVKEHAWNGSEFKLPRTLDPKLQKQKLLLEMPSLNFFQQFYFENVIFSLSKPICLCQLRYFNRITNDIVFFSRLDGVSSCLPNYVVQGEMGQGFINVISTHIFSR